MLAHCCNEKQWADAPRSPYLAAYDSPLRNLRARCAEEWETRTRLSNLGLSPRESVTSALAVWKGQWGLLRSDVSARLSYRAFHQQYQEDECYAQDGEQPEVVEVGHRRGLLLTQIVQRLQTH